MREEGGRRAERYGFRKDMLLPNIWLPHHAILRLSPDALLRYVRGRIYAEHDGVRRRVARLPFCSREEIWRDAARSRNA